MKIKRILRTILCLSLLLVMIGGLFTTASADQWMNSNGRWWYRYNNGGYPRNEWRQIGGSWYWFDRDGWMVTGIQQIGGQTYLFGGGGAMLTGWQQYAGSWYFADPSGALATGWRQIGGLWYFFEQNHVMKTGWLNLGNEAYFFYNDGHMAANTYIEDIWCGPDGRADVRVYVETTEVTLMEGTSQRVKITLRGGGTVIYSVGNYDIINCTADNVWQGDDTWLTIHGLMPGKTTITITNSENSGVYTINVNVTPIFTVSATEITVQRGRTASITLTDNSWVADLITTYTYDIGSPTDVCTCNWSTGFDANHNAQLYITGSRVGTTYITITNDRTRTSYRIKVTVY